MGLLRIVTDSGIIAACSIRVPRLAAEEFDVLVRYNPSVGGLMDVPR
jgi:hypothetical protein